jgi:hypothetical protein
MIGVVRLKSVARSESSCCCALADPDHKRTSKAARAHEERL